jgi:ferredoxin
MGNTAVDNYYVITEDTLNTWMDRLIEHTHAIGPMKFGNEFKFGNITDSSRLRLDYPISANSPPTVLFGGSRADAPVHLVSINKTVKGVQALGDGHSRYMDPPPPTPQLAIGLHPHTLHSLKRWIADRMPKGHPDKIFAQWLEATAIIGLDLNDPPPNSFCASMGTHTIDHGYDIMLTQCFADGSYLIEVATQKGVNLFSRIDYYRPATEEDLHARELHRAEVAGRYPYTLSIPRDTLPTFFKSRRGHAFFADTAKRCTLCTKCTVSVCESCTCFERTTQPSLDGATATIDRTPFSCQNPEYWKTADGSVIHSNPADLREWWFICKVGSERTYHTPDGYTEMLIDCTGCGKCKDSCAPDITFPPDAITKILEMEEAL